VAYSQWLAGQRITAGQLAAISPKWQDWTPTWTTSTGAATPSFGNATITARYCQTADLVLVKFEVVFGSTTNFGGGGASDNWRFSLPVAGISTHQVIGWGEVNKSGSKRHVCRMRMTTTTEFELELSSGAPDGLDTTADGANGGGKGLVDAVSPWSNASTGTTWASGYAIRGEAQYEAA
jgi:hypothetical protein